MRIAVLLFPRVTALDAVGPYELLQRLPDTSVTFVGHRRGEIRSDHGFLGLSVDRSLDELTDPDVVVVPGGPGVRPLLTDMGFRYAGTYVPLVCDTAFVYDLEVKKIPIV